MLHTSSHFIILPHRNQVYILVYSDLPSVTSVQKMRVRFEIVSRSHGLIAAEAALTGSSAKTARG